MRSLLTEADQPAAQRRSSYSNHGNICKLLPNNFGVFQFTTPLPPPPPPPPPSGCNVGAGIKAKCSQLGGSWSDETCL